MPRHPRPRPLSQPSSRRALATAALLTSGAAALAAGCTSGAGSPDQPGIRETCQEYHRIVNQWSSAYGAEMGAVGQAESAGDQGRRRTTVVVVRDLFARTAEDLREQAGQSADPDLADALTEAADGLSEIAGQIETYQDVTEAPERMSSGRFGAGGERVSTICAG